MLEIPSPISYTNFCFKLFVHNPDKISKATMLLFLDILVNYNNSQCLSKCLSTTVINKKLVQGSVFRTICTLTKINTPWKYRALKVAIMLLKIKITKSVEMCLPDISISSNTQTTSVRICENRSILFLA